MFFGEQLMVPRLKLKLHQETKSWPRRLNCDIPSPFTRFAISPRGDRKVKRFPKLNELDLGALSQEQADGAFIPVATATANRRLEIPTPSFVGSSQHVDEDTCCLLQATRKR